MNKFKTNAGLCARLSFIFGLLFCILFSTTPLVILFLGNFSAFLDATLSVWVLLILTMAVVALVLGIIAVWKENRKTLSDRERRMAKGGQVLSAVFLLFAVISFIGGELSKAPHDNSRTLCMAEMKMARLALELYQMDHGDFPASSEWEEVVNQEFPMDETRKKDLMRLEQLCPGHHFIYWKPQVSDMNHHVPLLADAEPYHEGEYHVIFLDGTIETLSSEEYEVIVPKASSESAR